MIEQSQRPRAKRLSLSDLPIGLGLVLCGLATALHVIQLYSEIERLERLRNSTVLVDPSPFFPRLQGLLVLAFFIGAVGLLLRSRLGLIVSVLSLAFVLLVYGHWYQFSYRLLKIIREGVALTPAPELVPSHPLGLVYASWLDIAILFAVVIVLAWQIKFLIGTFRHRDRSN